LIQEAEAFARAHGLVLGSKVAPCTLQPTKFPKSLFTKALGLVAGYNILVHKICNDDNFLLNIAFKGLNDPFTQSLLKIYKQVHMEGSGTKMELGIHRSDYMLHSGTEACPTSIYQVELNTIAASFPCLSVLAFKLHRYLIERGYIKSDPPYDINELPANNAGDGVADALAAAQKTLWKPNGSCNDSDFAWRK